MNPSKVIIHEMQGYGVGQILNQIFSQVDTRGEVA